MTWKGPGRGAPGHPPPASQRPAPSSAGQQYEPPSYTPLTTPHRHFEFGGCGGNVTISQHWGQNGARTGSAVWDAATVLAHYIDSAPTSRWVEGSSSLELGAGLGLASIVASRCGFARAMATDGDLAVVPMARQNMADNDAAVTVTHLEWADDASLQALLAQNAPNLVMASDVIYLGSTSAWSDLLNVLVAVCRSSRRAASADRVPVVRREHAAVRIEH